MNDPDVLVVGARCAGAALATHLAREGKRVIVVDGATRDSDQPISTHVVASYGLRCLDELGVGAEVRAIAPPRPGLINAVEDAAVYVDFPEESRPSSIRRGDLDRLLAGAAERAGAELRFRTKVVELVEEKGRVVGAVVEERGGARTTIRAPLVVGADGRHSFVARAVKSPAYDVTPVARGAYWSYWPLPADFDAHPFFRGAPSLLFHGRDYSFVFPTNRDQLLVGLAFPLDTLSEWRGRHRATLLEKLRSRPLIAPLVAEEPIEAVRGVIEGEFYFRQAAGPGWALVGDAGLHKDPAPGFGITDALRDARALATAIGEGTEEALVAYWRTRDAVSHELFHFANDMGDPGYNTPLARMFIEKMQKHRWLRDGVVDIHERRAEPSKAFPALHTVAWTAGELLRGNFGVWKPFLAAGKRDGEVQKEKARRVRLAEEAVRAARAVAP